MIADLARDLSFAAKWEAAEQEQFVARLAELLVESVRTGDPEPCELFLEAAREAAAHGPYSSPKFSGALSPAVEAELSARLARPA